MINKSDGFEMAAPHAWEFLMHFCLFVCFKKRDCALILPRESNTF